MKKIKYYREIAFMSLATVGLAVLGLSYYFKNDVSSYLLVENVQPGTEISYSVSSDGQVLDYGTVKTKDSSLKISLSEESKSAEDLQYQISLMNDQTEAKALDMIMELDKSKNNLRVKGVGLPEFSELSVNKATGVDEKISSDWAGLISSEVDIANSPFMQLALQNSGIDADFNPFGDARIEVFFGDSSADGRPKVRSLYTQALFDMVEELTVAMALQTEIIGTYFDATNLIRTNRKHQELRARAHKDYHPSEQMCRVGTFVRSVAHSERKSEIAKHTLNRYLMNLYLATPNNSAELGARVFEDARLKEYEKEYCDPRDFGGAAAAICDPTGTLPNPDEQNRDIDFAQTVAGKLTLDIDFLNVTTPAAGAGTPPDPAAGLTDDEEAVIAMAKNLYFRNVFERSGEDDREETAPSVFTYLDPLARITQIPHFDSRSFAAKMNVAHNSFINIIGMKTAAPEGQPTDPSRSATNPVPPPLGSGSPLDNALPFGVAEGTQSEPTVTNRAAVPVLAEDTGWAHMKAMLLEFGITDENGSGDTTDEIDLILGERPSYYAQMEVLTKKIYQNPNFFTNLYDKPANVARIGVSLDAIELMSQRDRFDSLLRQEMLSSVLLEEALAPHVEEINANIFEEMQREQRKDP